MYCFQDFGNNKKNTKGKIVAFCFRLANLGSTNKAYKIILFPYLVFYKIIFEWFMGFEVPYTTKIGKGFKVYHLQSIVINKNTVIGNNFVIRQCLTIGNSRSGGNCPVIKDNVEVGANVCIIGDIEIGEGVIIGAGSVVVKSVPANCVVAGNPAKVIKQLI